MHVHHQLPRARARFAFVATFLVGLVTAAGVTASGAAAVEPVASTAAASTGPYRPLSPARVLDTRVDSTRLAANQDRRIRVAGVVGIPSDGVRAVALNLTAIAPERPGYLTLDSRGTNQPRGTSTVNFGRATVANSVITGLDANGYVYVRSTSDVDVAIDVMGWYGTESTTTHPVAPVRLLDTRSGIGAARGPVVSGGFVDLQVTGRGGLPATGVSTVVLNLTSTGATGVGYATAYPSGDSRPEASSLNYTSATTAGAVFAQVAANGRVRIAVSRSTQLVADVTAWYGDGTDLTTSSPVRVLDTRSGVGAPKGRVVGGTEVEFAVAGRATAPSEIQAAVLTVTAVGASGAGYVTAYGKGNSRPTTSAVNFEAGVNRANTVIVPINETFPAVLYASAQTDLVVDLVGYVQGPSNRYGYAQAAAIGDTNACFVAEVGNLTCAGTNASGQLDAPWAPARSLTRVSTRLADVVDVDVTPANPSGFTTSPANTHMCAVDRAGKVYCSGANASGQLGTDSPLVVANGQRLPVAGLPVAADVAVGVGFSCAATTTGEVWCWGSNSLGQLGDGTTTSSTAPVRVPGLTGAVSVVAGPTNACARTSADELWCWGGNARGVLGTGDDTPTPGAVRVPIEGSVYRADVGPSHACATLAPGASVVCWGDVHAIGPFFGNGPTTSRIVPPTRLDTSGFYVAVGADHTCVWGSAVTCFGWDGGQLGTGSVTPAFRGFTDVHTIWPSPVRSVLADDRAMCVLSTLGEARCADGRVSGRLGTGGYGPTRQPTDVLGFFR